MSSSELELFAILKQRVLVAFKEAYPAVSDDFTAWKVHDIANFQEALEDKVNGRISERWFYNYFKTDDVKLPRIDMLNLLSQYIGYENWDEFAFHQQAMQVEEVEATAKAQRTPLIGKPLFLISAVILGAVVVYWIFFGLTSTDVTVCLLDADTKQAITQAGMEVHILKEGESPWIRKVSEKTGCVRLITNGGSVQYQVIAPYYKTVTVTRKLDGSALQEVVHLQKDDYALMIIYFSTDNTKEWKKRRTQLETMLADDAVIYQVMGSEVRGIEMLNKQEFIDKLTMPLESLKNIQVLDTRYNEEGQIITLRFTQNATTP